ncbi:MAG: hypothetical protein ACXWEY_01835 [Bacteroidia bacterium]
MTLFRQSLTIHFLAFILMCFSQLICKAQYHTSQRIDFADSLFKKADFESALFEYEAIGKNTKPSDAIQQKIIFCNYLLRRYDTAFKLVSASKFTDYKTDQLKNRLLLQKGEKPYKLEPETTFNKMHHNFIQAGDYLLSSNIDSFKIARQIYNGFTLKDTFLENRFQDLEFAYTNFKKKGKKSALLAATLSAVIPGSGKIYCGRPKEAIAPFLRVAVSSLIAYEGYRKNGFNSPQFYLFGGIATYFYAANIAGAIKLAKYKNKKNELLYKNAVMHQMDLGMQYLLIRD